MPSVYTRNADASSRRRLWFVVAAWLSIVTVVFAGDAVGFAGSAADPANDVFDQDTQKKGPGKLDIVKIEHTDDGRRIVYSMTTKDAFQTADVGFAHWNLDGLSGVKRYDCAPVVVMVSPKAPTLKGSVKQCLGSGGGGEGGPGGFKELGDAKVSHVDGSKLLKVSYDIAVLRQAGFSGSSYTYRMLAAAPGDKAQDPAPDVGKPEIEHKLSPPPTPTPTATPKPTPGPKAEPTLKPEPTPEPVPTFTLPPAGFAAPEESEAPPRALWLGLAATVVSFAGGLALVRFRGRR